MFTDKQERTMIDNMQRQQALHQQEELRLKGIRSTLLANPWRIFVEPAELEKLQAQAWQAAGFETLEEKL